MQLTADKAAVESTLSLKEEEVRLHPSIALAFHVHQGTGPVRPLRSFSGASHFVLILHVWHVRTEQQKQFCDGSSYSTTLV